MRLTLVLSFTLFVATAITVLALMPTGTVEAPVRHDGPWNHGLAFAVLVAPLVSVVPRRIVIIAVAAALFGGTLELLQGLVGRSPEVLDVVANLVGVVAGCAVGCIASRWRIPD
ncbi:MAG: hypothetical protein AAF668_15555 [Pseudomonadota bacterium]